jgi:hypothetical protein
MVEDCGSIGRGFALGSVVGTGNKSSERENDGTEFARRVAEALGVVCSSEFPFTSRGVVPEVLPRSRGGGGMAALSVAAFVARPYDSLLASCRPCVGVTPGSTSCTSIIGPPPPPAPSRTRPSLSFVRGGFVRDGRGPRQERRNVRSCGGGRRTTYMTDATIREIPM